MDPTGLASNADDFSLPKAGRRHLALLGGTVSFADCLAATRHLLDPRRLVSGPAIEEYERSFARTIGARHAFSFSSARVGFYGLLRILGVGPGDEVLLQVPTHIVVANAIRYVGARPVYVDCTPETFNMDLAEAQRKITPRTRILLIQHTFGIPADMDAALSLAHRHGLVLLEDCVHALGARYHGKMIGSFGKAAFFSTEETKIISTTMGGMVVTDDAELAGRLKQFREKCPPPPASLAARYILKLVLYYFLMAPCIHFYTRAIYEFFGRRLPLPRPTCQDELLGHKPHVYEQLMSSGQAVVGMLQLDRLKENIAHRRVIAALYGEALAKAGIRTVQVPPEADPAFVRFPVWVKDRSAVVAQAASHMVMGTWFTSVLEEAVSPQCGDYEMGSCPHAEAAARHLVNLPTHPRVTAADAQAIVSLITACESSC